VLDAYSTDDLLLELESRFATGPAVPIGVRQIVHEIRTAGHVSREALDHRPSAS
jgi:hypothetical protein